MQAAAGSRIVRASSSSMAQGKNRSFLLGLWALSIGWGGLLSCGCVPYHAQEAGAGRMQQHIRISSKVC